MQTMQPIHLNNTMHTLSEATTCLLISNYNKGTPDQNCPYLATLLRASNYIKFTLPIDQDETHLNSHAYVDFQTDAEVKRAFNELHNFVWYGRRLKVSIQPSLQTKHNTVNQPN